MYTSLVLVALMGPDAAPGQALRAPSWQETYAEARQVGKDQGKPVAVFLGTGRDGWAKLSRESKLSAPVLKALANRYVCVYLDVTTVRGRKLANDFGMKDGPALVLSTADGEEQAFRHEGRMSQEELEGTLERFSGEQVSARTESLQRTRTSFSYVPSNGTQVEGGRPASTTYRPAASTTTSGYRGVANQTPATTFGGSLGGSYAPSTPAYSGASFGGYAPSFGGSGFGGSAPSYGGGAPSYGGSSFGSFGGSFGGGGAACPT